jgi:peroxiredoxin
MWSHLHPIEVKPGEVTPVTYGGIGRPVVGKVVASDPARKIEWQSGHHTLHTPMPKPPKGLKTQEEWQAWYETPAYKEARERYRYYAVRFASNGTFRIEDIPPGQYEIRFDFREPEEGPGRMGKHIGSITKEFEVSEISGGVSDEPLDLGEMGLSLRNDLRAGASVPAFEVKALDGKALKLADFRGKFVLLDFWATWCGPCVAEVPELKALFDEFGKDERFVMVSLSLDSEVKAPQEFVRKHKLDWVQGFLGEWSRTPLPNQYGVEGIPAMFLIDPEGKLLAKDLRGANAKAAVAKALNDRAAK